MFDLPLLLVLIIVLAFIFDYINGFHDSANAITNVVSTKVLTPFQAVLWAASFNFLAFSLENLKSETLLLKPYMKTSLL